MRRNKAAMLGNTSIDGNKILNMQNQSAAVDFFMNEYLH